MLRRMEFFKAINKLIIFTGLVCFVMNAELQARTTMRFFGAGSPSVTPISGNARRGIEKSFLSASVDPDQVRIREGVEFFCGRDGNGRLLGSAGERIAGNYIADVFEKANLLPVRMGGLGGASIYHMPWAYPGASLTILNPDTPLANAWWLSEAVSRAGNSSNICGMLPGVDPGLKSEFIVVTAHYDHLGMTPDGGYYPGADDNASGTAGLLELVQCLKDFRPKRSILFLACSGEEKGLLGSEAFVRSGYISLDAIKCNINLDMIGRNGSDELHVTPARTEHMVSSLTRDAREVAAQHGIVLSAGIERFIRQSDHYTFAKRGIPSIFFNANVHGDLHKTTDTPDKLNYEKMTKVIKITRDLLIKVGTDLIPPYLLPKSEWSSWSWATGGFFMDGGERLLGAPAEE